MGSHCGQFVFYQVIPTADGRAHSFRAWKFLLSVLIPKDVLCWMTRKFGKSGRYRTPFDFSLNLPLFRIRSVIHKGKNTAFDLRVTKVTKFCGFLMSSSYSRLPACRKI